MSVSMPLKPPFKPGTFVTTVVFIFNTETPGTSYKLSSRLGHHVKVVLRGVVNHVGDGRERRGEGFPHNALRQV